MTTTATVRDLRNRFPKVKKLVETEGEVLVTDRGQPRYRLTLYAPVPSGIRPAPKDYVARLRRFQPRPLSASAAKALDEENRGGR
jgi:antitoxin (DNA-binding transcriptional repressor) of toxin-antitoxin stability system